jgi:hypothetical protein
MRRLQMRRMVGPAVALVLVISVVAPVAAGRPYPDFRLDRVCRTEGAITFSVSWPHLHPQPTGVRVWAGTSESDPGVFVVSRIVGHHVSAWTFQVPASWFDDAHDV